jgi:hypothetical protein
MTERRQTKLARMTEDQKSAEVLLYWSAPEDAVFSQETLAIVYNRSIAWFQLKRCSGGGIKFCKAVGTRSIVYRKSDARNYFEGRFVEHTSALGSHSVSARRAKA